MSDKASGSARILIAEDDESNRKATSAMLKHLGYSVDAVSNGKEVLMALDRQPYDIILMNLRMPEMNGLEATRQIRKRYPLNMQPKIIAHTATATPECRDTCLKAGMNDFVAKPVNSIFNFIGHVRNDLNSSPKVITATLFINNR